MDNHAAKAKSMLGRCGYANGGGLSASSARLKSAAQGKVMGAAPPMQALAKGGKVRGRHSTHVNVMIAPQGGGAPPPRPVPVPVPMGGPPGAGGPPPPMGLARPPGMPPPPGAGMPPGGPPPGLAGGIPPGLRPGMKRGGGVKGYPLDDGAGGGAGRKEKAAAYGGRPR